MDDKNEMTASNNWQKRIDIRCYLCKNGQEVKKSESKVKNIAVVPGFNEC